MGLQSSFTINSRADLDALEGTPEHAEFMKLLKGSMTRKQDVAVRPDNYASPEYVGDVIPPLWVDVEDLSTLAKYGLEKRDVV